MLEPTLNYVLCPDAAGTHRMAYWQWGDPDAGHVVLCVHGLSRQGRDFDVLAQALLASSSTKICVVCPDVAGRGQSEWLKDATAYQIPTYAADMVTLIRRLAPVRLDWVGTSMGGLIGLGLLPHAQGLQPTLLRQVPAQQVPDTGIVVDDHDLVIAAGLGVHAGLILFVTGSFCSRRKCAGWIQRKD